MKFQVTAVRSALTLALLAMGALAQAATTYHITLLKPSVVAGKELKPGEFLGEVPLLLGTPTFGSLRAQTSCRMARLD